MRDIVYFKTTKNTEEDTIGRVAEKLKLFLHSSGLEIISPITTWFDGLKFNGLYRKKLFAFLVNIYYESTPPDFSIEIDQKGIEKFFPYFSKLQKKEIFFLIDSFLYSDPSFKEIRWADTTDLKNKKLSFSPHP